MGIVKNAIERQSTYKNRFILIDELGQYFDVKYRNYKSEQQIQRILRLSKKDFLGDMLSNKIPSYNSCIFQENNREGYYNLFDKETLAKPSEKIELNKHIKDLLLNLCNNEERDLEWLLKAMAFKYTHIDDCLLPAVIFRGVGGTGKGLFINLLQQIFGEQNCLLGLNQDNINSNFSTFDGTQLIVEYKEIANPDANKGKANMGKLKALIMESNISVERKGVDSKAIQNKAWFVMSSNDPVPLQLDPSDSGNRRFTLIKTGPKIDEYEGAKIAAAISNKENISNFLAYLLDKFPEIKKETRILALDNAEKRRIEKLCDPVCNKFFKWFEEKEPEVYKISIDQFKIYLDTYRLEIGEDDYTDARYKPRNFNRGISDRYTNKNIKIGNKTQYGYYINKSPEELQAIEGDGTTEQYLKTIATLKNN